MENVGKTENKTIKTKIKRGNMDTQKAVTKKESALPGSHTPLAQWGTATVSSKMLLIPKIMVMQLTSKFVRDEKATFGDFISSLTEQKIGSYKQPLDIIPIYMYEIWVVYDVIKGKREYREIVPVSDLNDNWKFKDTDESGKAIDRDRVANLYCLLPSDIQKGGEIPYLLSFRSTSRIAGRKIATQMYALNSGANKSPASKIFTITGEKKDGDKGAWVQLDAKVARDSTQQEEMTALKWYKTIMAGQTKVEHDDIVTESKEETKNVSDY